MQKCVALSNNSVTNSSNVRSDLDQEKLIIMIYPQVGEGLSGFGSGHVNVRTWQGGLRGVTLLHKTP